MGFLQPDENTAVRCPKILSWFELTVLRDFIVVVVVVREK